MSSSSPTSTLSSTIQHRGTNVDTRAHPSPVISVRAVAMLFLRIQRSVMTVTLTTMMAAQPPAQSRQVLPVSRTTWAPLSVSWLDKCVATARSSQMKSVMMETLMMAMGAAASVRRSQPTCVSTRPTHPQSGLMSSKSQMWTQCAMRYLLTLAEPRQQPSPSQPLPLVCWL